MEFSQGKNTGRVTNIIFTIFTILTSYLATTALANYGIVSQNSGRTERIFAGILFTIFALYGITMIAYYKITGKYHATIEFTKDEIICREKHRTVIMKWKDVSMVSLFPGYMFIPTHRLVFFTSGGVKHYLKTFKITNKRMWSEYNDEMLVEIKKYWTRRIINEDRYIKYKNKRSNWK